jgi:hypothetical protein
LLLLAGQKIGRTCEPSAGTQSGSKAPDVTILANAVRPISHWFAIKLGLSYIMSCGFTAHRLRPKKDSHPQCSSGAI